MLKEPPPQRNSLSPLEMLTLKKLREHRQAHEDQSPRSAIIRTDTTLGHSHTNRYYPCADKPPADRDSIMEHSRARATCCWHEHRRPSSTKRAPACPPSSWPHVGLLAGSFLLSRFRAHVLCVFALVCCVLAWCMKNAPNNITQ